MMETMAGENFSDGSDHKVALVGLGNWKECIPAHIIKNPEVEFSVG